MLSGLTIHPPELTTPLYKGSRDKDVVFAVREIMHENIQQKIDDVKNSLLELGVNYDG